jgi:ketosteroid isomerase-like protein
MSSQNVEAVQRLIGALNRGDVDDMVTGFYSPDAEFIPAMQAALEGTVYRGSAEIRAIRRDLWRVGGPSR